MKKMQRKFFLLLLAMIICLCSTVVVSANSTDYVKMFGEFINYSLDDFLMQNYGDSSVDHFCDCYMVDMDNNSVPELLCLFTDDDHGGMFGYAAYIEYDNGFKMGSEIPFDFYDGSESLWYQILEKDGKFYTEKFISSTYSDGMISESETSQVITINQNGIETVVYSANLKGTTNFHSGIENYNAYINGQKVEELDYEYVRKNFNIVADSADYNYNPFAVEEVQHNYGRDYDKFWKTTNAITVTLNGKKIDFDQQPIIVNDRTLVPLRAIFEAMGATVEWNADTRTVTSTKGSTNISMTIGNNTMHKNGQAIELDVAPQLVGGRTLVPVRAVAESFGCKVDWDANTRTVIIASDKSYPYDFNGYADVTESMSESMKKEFNSFVCAEAMTAEVAPYNILENYDCNQNNDIREIMWHFMTDYANSYMREIPEFYMFDSFGHTEYVDDVMRTESYLLDMIIKEYYNISEEIPKFEQYAEFGSGSLYYSNGYYFTKCAERGAMYYETIIDKIYNLGDNKYGFVYRLGIGDPGMMEIDTISKSSYYAVMERKYINDESFSDLEFWSILNTGIYTP